MQNSNNNLGITKESTLRVEVPIPTLELLTNKRLENNQTYIVSNLMSDSTNNVGIYKDSSLVVSVSPYLPNNFTQTLNYVGYWKWDSTSNTFIRGTGIDSSNYNLFIDPIWYDGEDGSKKRIRITNGEIYDINTVDTDGNGAMEVNVTQNQNNQQIQRLERALKSTTRDTNNLYNSFEVEAIPPTITTDITSNGYYKFNDNWNGLVSGTSSDYNLNINVSTPTPTISVTDIKLGGNSIAVQNQWTFTRSSQSISGTSGYDIVIIRLSGNYYYINFYHKTTSSSISVSSNSWYWRGSSEWYFLTLHNNDTIILELDDTIRDSYDQKLLINKNYLNFSGIPWMTFN